MKLILILGNDYPKLDHIIALLDVELRCSLSISKVRRPPPFD